jgi:hypothetical protein
MDKWRFTQNALGRGAVVLALGPTHNALHIRQFDRYPEVFSSSYFECDARFKPEFILEFSPLVRLSYPNRPRLALNNYWNAP